MSEVKEEVVKRRVRNTSQLLKDGIQAKRLNAQIRSLKGLDYVLYAIEIEKMKVLLGT